MKRALLVATREYLENAKTKGFWIGIFLFPAIIGLSILVPTWLDKKGTPVRHFVLVDQSGQFEKAIEDGLQKAERKRALKALVEYAGTFAAREPGKDAASPGGTAPPGGRPVDAFLKQFADGGDESLEAFAAKGGTPFFLEQLRGSLREDAPRFEEPRKRFRRVDLPGDVKASADIAALAQELKPYLRGAKRIATDGSPSELYAAVLIPPDIDKLIVRPGSSKAGAARPGGHSVEYWSGNLADTQLREQIEGAINGAIRKREYQTRGMDAAAIAAVERTRAPFANLNPKKEEGKEAVGMADIMRQWAPTGFVYLLWIAIFAISQMLLNNTIEEKSNRIIEVLLSSVTPGELMMGKLLGIAAVGLTMVGAWMGALVGMLAWKSDGTSEVARQLFVVVKTSNLLPAFGIYFVLGYMMYAGIILAIGSVCNTIKESQNYMGVITLILMVPLMTMTFIPKDPNGAVATALSWIPLYTPFVMMNRAAADPPLFDIIGTTILLLVSTCVVLWMSVKVFRTGVLRTGQPPRLIEMIRWMRA